MGFQFDVLLIGSFMDGVAYVRNVKVCTYSMICYVTRCVGYSSENFELGSLHDGYVGLESAIPQFYSIAPYSFNCRYVDEKFIFHR